MDKVIHFEIPAEDRERAKAFYASSFGWATDDVPGMDYTILRTVAVDEQQMPTEPGAINGGMMRRSPEYPSGPVLTIGVDSIDAALQRIQDAGGSVVRPRTAIPGMGAFAYFTDSEGNTLGLWETAG